MDIFEESLELHKKLRGKFETTPKAKINSQHDLALMYSPGVARISEVLASEPERASELTIKSNCVAVVSDGSAVLGLGNIGPYGAIPVMEGKAVLFKQYAGVDAFPICVRTQDAQDIIKLVRNISPVFAGVNLEDISAPRCFEIEESLQDLGIPVFHDDQHGTAIVTVAAMINAAKLAGKDMTQLKVVINGAGAAGTAIAKMLLCVGHDPEVCQPVKEVLICDSKAIISRNRADIKSNAYKVKLSLITNHGNVDGELADAMVDADVFVGVSVAGAVTQEMVRSMADKPVILAMANPTPEIMPDEAFEAGAFVVGTGRSDFPNQVNNVLAYPGIFRGAIDAGARRITEEMKLAAARALADAVENPEPGRVIPSVMEEGIAAKVAQAVADCWANRKS
ncbi:MAG: NADP-dependent malic enzyme [Leptospirales bacterium]|jgi:malate dehydrogenase (oxaloacetate-decarboxylating)